MYTLPNGGVVYGPAQKSSGKVIVIAITGLTVLFLFWAFQIGASKAEMKECQRWATWSPETHEAWADWQIEQCKAHGITLQ